MLLESRLKQKQKQIANILYQRELTIYRQQKIIEALSSRLELHGLDNQINIIDSTTECDLNDSDSAVVLEEIDDCSSLVLKRKSCSSDVVRSISDVIQMPRRTNLQKSNCYLRRPDILETVYSVEEDPDQAKEEQEQNQLQSSSQSQADVAEKRDKFRNRSDKRVSEAVDDSSDTISITTNQSSSSSTFWEKLTSYYDSRSSTPVLRRASDDDGTHTTPQRGTQMMNYNRVMSNHRSVTKPKDVKYKRINKAKSKSLEELRGKLKNWVEHRNNSGSYNVQQESSRTYEDAWKQQVDDYDDTDVHVERYWKIVNFIIVLKMRSSQKDDASHVLYNKDWNLWGYLFENYTYTITISLNCLKHCDHKSQRMNIRKGNFFFFFFAIKQHSTPT